METELDAETAKSSVLNWASISHHTHTHKHTYSQTCMHTQSTPVFSFKSSDGEY